MLLNAVESTQSHRNDEEQVYLETRAEAELSLAQSAAHPAVVRAHYILAGFYLDRLYNGGAAGDPGAPPGEQSDYALIAQGGR